MAQVWRSVGDALWSVCAADSMSMPVHWYYDTEDIRRDFGCWISGFRRPGLRHPSSILSLSSTTGSGRTACSSGAKRPDVVGNVILHDKLNLWKSSKGSVHYHQGLQSGDNTLNVLCCLRAVQSLVSGRFTDVSQPDARAAVLADYVCFLTTPGSHRDTYAESSHRAFFADWQDCRPTSPRAEVCRGTLQAPAELPSADSQLDAIGCLPMVLPFVLLSASANEEQAVSAAVEFVKLTHPHPKVPEYVSIYSRALHAVLGGAGVRQQAERALRRLDAWDACQSYSRKAARSSESVCGLQCLFVVFRSSESVCGLQVFRVCLWSSGLQSLFVVFRFALSSEDGLRVHQSAVDFLGLACYTKGALCSLFYLAHEFHDDPRGGILANTNCGGENCNRGAALGALLGAGGSYSGAAIPQEWKDELRDAREFIPGVLKQLQ
ncbi:hypothetical protein D5F01_LYC23480 [Larimichthys crocea]|uniref:Uncharacterized protein n=1 Tax=Larimichthys crocea TaxID=215358 RepID=A0A6G0HHB0_LARCR|nr:hypothetical protein D5F01_LYC23480 [Larimichthys crocea]